MQKIIRGTVYILLLIGLSTLGVSCSDEEEGSSDGSSGGGSPIDDVPVGVVDSTGFWVNILTDQFDLLIDERGKWDSTCLIETDEAVNTLMTCDVEILEGDLYFNDLEVQYNAPPETCDYVRVLPSWHWNLSVGTGPSAVTITENNSGGVSTVNSCTADHDGDAMVLACGAHDEISAATTAGPTCVYDRSSEDGGKNCCFGTYTYNFTEDTDEDGTPDTARDPETRNWDGDVGACIDPYISKTWSEFSEEGYPVPKIEKVPRDPDSETPAGLNSSFTLSANINTVNNTFSSAANYYQMTPPIHQHSGFRSATTSDLPYAFDPIDDVSGTAIPGGEIARGRVPWIVQCMDAGREVKHEIHLYIREWNTLVDFAAYVASEGATVNPDTTGLEGTNCDYDPIFGNNNCNDRIDFLDVLNAAGGSYDTVPGVDEANRVLYFPNQAD